MEQNKFDDQLKEYFQKQKAELNDKEFTERVMRSLPGKEKHSYIIYLFVFIGALLLLLLNGTNQFMVTLNDLVVSIAQMNMSVSQMITVVVAAVVVLSVSVIALDKDDTMISI